MNRTRFTFIFFVKRGKLLKNGEAPICLRITVNGIAVESQIKRSVPPEAWDQNTQSVKGRDRRAQETNECIRMLKIRTLQIHRDLELSGGPFHGPAYYEQSFFRRGKTHPTLHLPQT